MEGYTCLLVPYMPRLSKGVYHEALTEKILAFVSPVSFALYLSSGKQARRVFVMSSVIFQIFLSFLAFNLMLRSNLMLLNRNSAFRVPIPGFIYSLGDTEHVTLFSFISFSQQLCGVG